MTAAKPMTESELVRILKEEEANASSFYNSELSKDQAGALDRYHARPYGDEVDGRSKVVSHDLEDTINWIMPDLMRVFMGSDELVTLDGTTEEDETSGRTKSAADYLEHQFRKDNDGDTVLHDFAFDGLLQRIGVVSVAWAPPKPRPPKVLEGVSLDLLVKYTQDPEYEILEQTENNGVFSLKVKQTPRMGRLVVEGVPPEEIAWSRAARSFDAADYQRRKRQKFAAELYALWPDLKSRLEAVAANKQEDDPSTDPRFIARYSDETAVATGTSDNSTSGGRQKLDLLEEYIRVDYDGDGIVELRSIKRVGDVICENEIVEKSEFVDWTPIRVAHRVAGRSMDDILKDLQKIKTVITRRVLDGLAQSLTSRKAVNTRAIDEEGITDLLDNDIGGVVRVDGPVDDAILELNAPDMSASGLRVLEYVDQRVEESSGVNRQSQGMDPQAMNKTASGIDLLQAAAKVRTELIARWLAKGLERVFKRMLEVTCAHQDGPRQIKIKGKFVEVDPRRWSDEMGVTVHVAMVAASRAAQVSNLSIVAAKQEKILMQAPNNPIVTPVHYRNTLGKLVEAMGFRDSTAFFAELPDNWQPPDAGQQAPDPKLLAVQAQIQADQAKAQAEIALQQAKAASAERMAQAEAAGKLQLEAQRLQNERDIAFAKIQAETQAAADRTVAEMALARWKAEEEMKLARERGEQELQLARDNSILSAAHRSDEARMKGGGVRMGGKIG